MSPGKHILMNIKKGDYVDSIKTIILLNQFKIKTYITIALDGSSKHHITNGYYRYLKDYTPCGDRIHPFKIIRPLNSSGALFQYPVPKQLVYLKKFQLFADKNHVCVVFMFPPFPKDEFTLNQSYISALSRLINEKFNISTLNSPSDTAFPKSYFADTVNHLQKEGEQIRTRHMISQLRHFIY